MSARTRSLLTVASAPAVPDAPLSRHQWWLVYLVLAVIGCLVGSWTAHAWL